MLAVLPRGGEAAKNPAYLCCIENGLNLRKWLEDQGHVYITTGEAAVPLTCSQRPSTPLHSRVCTSLKVRWHLQIRRKAMTAVRKWRRICDCSWRVIFCS